MTQDVRHRSRRAAVRAGPDKRAATVHRPRPLLTGPGRALGLGLVILTTTAACGSHTSSVPSAVGSAPSLVARDCRISFLEKRPGVRIVRRGGAAVVDAGTWPDARTSSTTTTVRHAGATWTMLKVHIACATSTIEPLNEITAAVTGPEQQSGYASYDAPATAQASGKPTDRDVWLLARVLPGSSVTGFTDSSGGHVQLSDVPTVGSPATTVNIPWVDR